MLSPRSSVCFFGSLLAAASLCGQSPKEVRRIAKDGVSAIPQLQRFLVNPDLKVRLEAVKSIVEIGGPRILDPLIEGTRDNDPEMQVFAVNGLVNFYLPGYVKTGMFAPIHKLSSDIRSRFSDSDDLVIDPYIAVRPDVQVAVGRIARSGSSLDARASAARAAGVLRAKAAIPDLIAALRSRDSDVILETLNAMEKIRDSSVCPDIHFLLNDLDEKVQIEALEAHGVLGCRGAKSDIREVLRRSDRKGVQRAALSTIAMLAEPTDAPVFDTYLNNPDERIRASAAEGFARLANIQDARKLQAVYDQEQRNAPRLALAFALVMEGNLATTQYAPLRYLLYGLNNNSYRAAAQSYLTEAARNPEVRNVLYAFVDEASRDEKVGIARALAASGDRQSIATLEKLSRDPDSVVAQEGLRQMRNLQART